MNASVCVFSVSHRDWSNKSDLENNKKFKSWRKKCVCGEVRLIVIVLFYSFQFRMNND